MVVAAVLRSRCSRALQSRKQHLDLPPEAVVAVATPRVQLVVRRHHGVVVRAERDLRHEDQHVPQHGDDSRGRGALDLRLAQLAVVPGAPSEDPASVQQRRHEHDGGGVPHARLDLRSGR
jgi:hypothetical protein